MRVLQVNNYGFVRGGSDQYFIELGRELARAGHEVEYLTAAHPANVVVPRHEAPGFDPAAPTTRDLPAFLFSPAARRTLRQAISERRPDLVHLHIYYGQLTASILRPLAEAGIPVVQTLHEYKLLCPVASMHRAGMRCADCAGGRVWPAVVHRCNRDSLMRSTASAFESKVSAWLGARDRIDHFIAVSEFLRGTMVEQGIAPDRISTVHNFVAHHDAPTDSGAGDYLLFLGRIEHVKGVGTLLEAMARLPGVELRIVGTGTAHAELERRARERRLDQVRFLGFRSGAELEALIAGARCMVVPSEWHEPFGLVLLESFARGRPVVATRVGGMTEVVDDGQDGLLVSPGDAPQLADALAWMMANPVAARRMGEAGRHKARTRFDAAGHVAKVLEIYRRVL